jgi:alpha-1,2-mannosyltransferase
MAVSVVVLLMGLVAAYPFLVVAAAALYLLKLRREYARHFRAEAADDGAKTVTVGVFHPYANGGGGGERVLYCALVALVRHFKRRGEAEGLRYRLRVVLYAGDDGLTASELVARAAERFNLPELATLRVDAAVTLVPLLRRDILDPSRYPRFTLLWQSVAQMRLALAAFQASRQRGLYPQFWLDTTGCPFSYVIASVRFGCTVMAYVHYPMISTDMIAKVKQRDAGFNNDSAIAASSTRSTAKYVYYRLFAAAYSAVGRFCTDVVMVNSTWTHNHIAQLWGKKPAIVYPPCGTMEEFMEFDLVDREPLALSISQFRPEKNQLLQLQALQLLLTEHADAMQTTHRDFKLVVLGSCRNADDEERVESLKEQAMELGISDRVQFVMNASFKEMKEYLRRSSIGIHTMYNEHFGISNVEMMAAGVVVIANNSGGPKLDIVKPGTGYLALTAAEYAEHMWTVLSEEPRKLIATREAAREQSLKFSDQVFEEQFMAAMDEGFAQALGVAASNQKAK